MHQCSLSITYICPYYNSTAIMGHSIHNIDISKPLNNTTPYMLSGICPVQWKPGFMCEENTCPKCQMPSNVSICQFNCSQVETPMKTMSMQMSFPDMVSDSLCRNSLVMQTDCCSSLPGWLRWSEDAGCGGPGLVWLHMVCSCEASWMYCQIF